MWHKVYYEHYDEDEEGAYWEEPEVLPYSVLCKDEEEKKKLCNLLRRHGYKGVGGNPGIKALLINTQFKRWCFYPKPAKMSCIDSRNYTFEEICAILFPNRKK
mgnify:CR=1 FL=1